jgi:septum formation protein
VIILASASAVRARLLDGAGVPFRVVSAGVDETAAKSDLLAAGAGPREIAAHLADAKAQAVAAEPQDVVIGADQTLDLDGELIDKVSNVAEARERLRRLSGKSHILHSAVAIARGGEVIWRTVSSPVMTLRPLSSPFVDRYLDRAGDGLLSSVGCYELEGLGAQLFERIDGDYFAVLGLPLIELLSALRAFGALAA